MHRYLLTFAVIVLASLPAVSSVFASQDDSLAKKLIKTQGCKACHPDQGSEGVVAVSLKDIRDNLSAEDVRLRLVNQAGRHGNSRIPDFSHLSEDEIDALVNFLTTDP